MKSVFGLSFLILAALTGDDPLPPAAGGGSTPTPAVAGAVGSEPGDFREWKGKPTEPFGDAEKSFRKAMTILKEKYVDAGLTEEDLWRGAAEGMLANAGGRKYDELLSPSEMKEIEGHLGGEIVGIGVEIKFDDTSGLAMVKGVLPGGAAEKNGLLAGDAILKVDGKSFRGKQYRDVLYAIRGKEGDPVTLTLLRDANVITKTVKRAKVAIQSVSDLVVAGDVGVLTIKTFHEKTPALVREALARLAARKVKALVVDLRNCPGGHFEKVLDGAGALLPKGTTIVSAVPRTGAEETYKAEGGAVLGALPTAVLVNEHTSSGGEILAGALQANGALVVGKKTYGKWNVQMIESLPNGYAMKFTTAIFKTPKGESLDGVGLLPDIEVEMDEAAFEAARNAPEAARVAADSQLRVAVNSLKR